MNGKSKRRLQNAVLTYLVIIISLIFFIVPMLWIGYTSFRTQASIFTGQIVSPWREYTLHNYETVLSVTDFPLYFWNSLQIGAVVTLFSLFVSIIGAYALSRFDIKGKNTLIVSIFSTQMFPQVLLIIPIYVVIFDLGLLARTCL